MNESELLKLKRAELLELLVEQYRRCDKLEWELAQAKKELRDCRIRLENAGSSAEASVMAANVPNKGRAAELDMENPDTGEDEWSRVLTRTIRTRV